MRYNRFRGGPSMAPDAIITEPGGGGDVVDKVIEHAETIGEHTAALAAHDAKLAEHDGAIGAVAGLAQTTAERVDGLASSAFDTGASTIESARVAAENVVADVVARVEALEAKVVEPVTAPAQPAVGDGDPPPAKHEPAKRGGVFGLWDHFKRLA